MTKVQIPDAAVQAALDAMQVNEFQDMPTHEQMNAALAAALPHLPLGYEVKKLGWVQDEHGSIEFTSQSIFGEYSVHIERKSAYACSLDGVKYEHININHPYTVDEAKAAAQADFERRVRECHVTKPFDVAAVRRQAFEEAANICVEYSKSFQKGLCHYGDADKDSWRGRQEGHIDAGNELASAIRALSAEPVQGEQWRDMKDAPRTGEEIIYLTKYGGIGYCKYTLAMSDDEEYLWWDFQSDADVYPRYWLPRTTLPTAPTPEAGA